MKYTVQFSLDIDFNAPALQALAETAGTNLDYLDQLIDVLSQVVSGTPWPESHQGEFLAFVTRDVCEFSSAISMEIKSGRWTVVGSLLRPLQERSEYVLAAAVDSGFSNKYLEHLNSRIDGKFADKPRGMVEYARGTIHRWMTNAKGQEELLQTSLYLNKLGSELLHHGIDLTEASMENEEVHRALLTMACGRVQLATLNVLLAAKVVGAEDTEAWRLASVIATRS